jgi:hypothetical protein
MSYPDATATRSERTRRPARSSTRAGNRLSRAGFKGRTIGRGTSRSCRPRTLAAVAVGVGVGVCPGREHATTPARAHPSLLAALDEWTDESHVALADLSYEGENSRLVCPIKARAGVAITAEQRTVNALHATTRAPGRTRQRPARDHLQGTAPHLRRACAGPACAPGVSALSPLLRWSYFTRTQPNTMISAYWEGLPVGDAVLTVPRDRSPM